MATLRIIIFGACLLSVCGCAQRLRGPKWVRARIGTGDTAEAKKLNEKAIRRIEKCEIEKAEKLLLESIRADPHFGPAINNLGRIDFIRRRYYDAAWRFQRAAELMPDSPKPWNNLGLVYESASRLDEAIESYEMASQIGESNADITGNMARAKMKRGDSFSEIEPLLRQILFIDPRCAWAAWASEQLAMAYKRGYRVTEYPSDVPYSYTPELIGPEHSPSMNTYEDTGPKINRDNGESYEGMELEHMPAPIHFDQGATNRIGHNLVEIPSISNAVERINFLEMTK